MRSTSTRPTRPTHSAPRPDHRPAGRLDDDLRRAAKLLREADHVLIAAGAGLSVDAGIDYGDPISFARDYPGMAARGFRTIYELFGYHEWSEALKWGYLASQVTRVRFDRPAHPVYLELRALVGDKDYFVMTSNADGQFDKSGFAPDRIFTPQGSYALMQCLGPCSTQTWPAEPIVRRILPSVDPATQEITDERVVPWCPRCGGPTMLNVRGGDWFIEAPYAAQAERLGRWLDGIGDDRLVVLELGAGFNTPGVIRWPMERLVRARPRSHLLRVNVHYPEVQTPLGERALSLGCRARDAIAGLQRAGD